MQRIYIRRHFLYLRLKSVKELVNYNTRKTMKQKQKLKRWSGVLIALGVLGSSFTSSLIPQHFDLTLFISS